MTILFTLHKINITETMSNISSVVKKKFKNNLNRDTNTLTSEIFRI